MNLISIDKTALNHHFNDPNFGGTKIPMNPEAFLEEMAIFWAAALTPGFECKSDILRDGLDPPIASGIVGCAALLVRRGYAPFCKHLFVSNFTKAKAGVAKITEENSHLLKSGYQVRNEGELPVLCRWFEGVEAPVAKYLDVILYTGEQLRKEGLECDTEWSIVCINAEMERKETPLNPMTQLRNALGSDEGGSGVPIDNETYTKAVSFWDWHAVVR